MKHPREMTDEELTWEEYKAKHYEEKLKCACCGKFNAIDDKKRCPKDKVRMISDSNKNILICPKCGLKIGGSIDEFRVELGRKGEFYCDECWGELGDERD